MRGVNKVILLGNLGQDPELRYFPSGDALCTCSLATSENWRDRESGEPQERTEWHKVVIKGKLAEIASQYLSKGSKVYFEGQLQTRKWQDSEGQDRYSTEVVVAGSRGVMQMLDSANHSQPEQQQRRQPPQQQRRQPPQQQHRQPPQQQRRQPPPPPDDYANDPQYGSGSYDPDYR